MVSCISLGLVVGSGVFIVNRCDIMCLILLLIMVFVCLKVIVVIVVEV